MGLAVRVAGGGTVEARVIILAWYDPRGVGYPEELVASGVVVAVCGMLVGLGGAIEDGLEQGWLGHRTRWRGRV